MKTRISFAGFAVFALLAGPGATSAQGLKSSGVFAKVDVKAAIKACKSDPKVQVHACLQSVYATMLQNPAISGLTIGVHWDLLSTSIPTQVGGWHKGPYEWKYLDDAFKAAGPGGQPVQIIVSAGFDSPRWVFSALPKKCDTLFPLDGSGNPTGSAPADCGSLKFKNYPEKSHTDGDVLPMPWHTEGPYVSAYLKAWADFLSDLNIYLAGQTLSPVALAISGPTSGSAEIIMPTTQNKATLPAADGSNLDVDTAWNAVITNGAKANPPLFTPGEEDTDQPFIDGFVQTIKAYQGTFSNRTLILLADSDNDLPEYGATSAQTHPDDFQLNAVICQKTKLPLSCEAKAEIIAQFADATDDAHLNMKALSVGGMTASSPLLQGNIGVPAVKCMATTNSNSDCTLDQLGLKNISLPPGQGAFLAGAEFDYPASTSTGSQLEQLGCPTYKEGVACGDLTPELAAFNVLANFFNDTGVASDYIDTVQTEIVAIDPKSKLLNEYKTGYEQVQFVDVSYTDVLYAFCNPCPPQSNKYTSNTSMQDLLNKAQAELTTINTGLTTLPPPATCTDPPPPIPSWCPFPY